MKDGKWFILQQPLWKGYFMENNVIKRKPGLSGNALRLWGFVFLIGGVVGRGVIQTHILGMNGAGPDELLKILDSKPNAMAYTALSLALQIAETCAVPIFAKLLIEGMQNTSDIKAYFKRVITLALLCEIPFNLTFGGKLIDLKSRNPIWAVVLCMFMLYLWSNYEGKEKKYRLLKLFIVIVTILWVQMLKVDHGAAFVIIVSLFWALRKKSLFVHFAGAAGAMLCSLISPYYLASPMGVLAVHSYNGVKSTNSHKYNYLFYPVVLMIGWILGIMLK